MTYSLANLARLFYSFSNSNLNNFSSKRLYISIFSYSCSSRANCYNSPFHQLDHLSQTNKYQLQGKMSAEFIKPSELVEIIKDTTKVPGKDYLVVDVRDDDYGVNTCQLFKIIFLYQNSEQVSSQSIIFFQNREVIYQIALTALLKNFMMMLMILFPNTIKVNYQNIFYLIK